MALIDVLFFLTICLKLMIFFRNVGMMWKYALIQNQLKTDYDTEVDSDQIWEFFIESLRL